VPPKGRIPGNPPRRRPRVAGLSQRNRAGAEPAGRPGAEPAGRPGDVSVDRPGDVSEQWADDVVTAPAPAASEPEVEVDEPPAPSAQPVTSAGATGAGAAEVEASDSGAERAPATVEHPHAVPGPVPARAAVRSGPLAGGLLLVLLLLVTVVFGAAALVFRGQAARAATGLTDNRAVVDTAATSEVVSQVSKAVETVLSYDYTRLDENEHASGEVITGKYKDEFAKTFADVRKTAPEQKLVLTTTVLLAGVTMLNDDRAELIATMDLAAVRDTTPYNSPGRVKVIAIRVDDRWKIAEMFLL
jgi:Mce-associated membrane protein